LMVRSFQWSVYNSGTHRYQLITENCELLTM
jgi:hypothetical protein